MEKTMIFSSVLDPQLGQLIGISAFYKNDKPDGYGVRFSGEKIEATANVIAENVAENLDELSPIDISRLLEKLLKDRDKDSLSLEERITAAVFIQALEDTGDLPKDDFNGMLYEYVSADVDAKAASLAIADMIPKGSA
jgi:hypothetical protein